MNCQRFTDVVGELARGQMMEADVRTDALVHSDACEKCAERLSHEQALTRAFYALSEQLQTRQAPDELEFELRKAFREQHASPSTVSVATSSRRYWLAVAAAILLVVGSLVVMRLRSDQPAPSQPQVASQESNAGPQKSPAPEKDVAASSGREPQREVQPKNRRRHMASARRNPRSRPEEAVATNHVGEIATEFIPLSYSSGLSLQDGGQIVRVELPRSALVKFGLPVNTERLNEKVKADVWLGVDGLAHAIRFVQ
jgi:hypothetical protein